MKITQPTASDLNPQVSQCECGLRLHGTERQPPEMEASMLSAHPVRQLALTPVPHWFVIGLSSPNANNQAFLVAQKVSLSWVCGGHSR